MPAYRSSRWDLKTCTRLRAMMARRTRRISSSLLPLNITPAMTSIHPPLWWNGPLGPLTSGRDLYEVSLRAAVCPTDVRDVGDRRDRVRHLALAVLSSFRSVPGPLGPAPRASRPGVL